MDGGFREIDAILIQAGRGAGFEAAHFQAQIGQKLAQGRGVRQAGWSGGRFVFADNYPPAQIGAATEHHRGRGENSAATAGHALHAPMLQQQARGFALANIQIFLQL